MLRSLRLTDLVDYLSFRRQATENLALAGPDGRARMPTVGDFVARALLLEPGQEGWGQFSQGQMVGIVAVRARGGAYLWEVDWLAAARTPCIEDVYSALLEHVCACAYEEAIQKVFLRVRADSSSIAAARRAGFYPYAQERIYQLGTTRLQGKGVLSSPNLRWQGLHPRQRADHQALFQLYCDAVPARVRQVEGITLQEWRWNDAWGLHSIHWRTSLSSRRRDFVLEENGRLTAWLQVDVKRRCLTLLADKTEGGMAGDILRYGIAQLDDRGPVLCPVREYQGGLGPLLEEEGFVLVAEHVLLARTFLLRVPEPELERKWVAARA